MQTLESAVAFIDGLNKWQATFWGCAALAAWLLLMEFSARLLAGGYPGDRTTEDDETQINETTNDSKS